MRQNLQLHSCWENKTPEKLNMSEISQKGRVWVNDDGGRFFQIKKLNLQLHQLLET